MRWLTQCISTVGNITNDLDSRLRGNECACKGASLDPAWSLGLFFDEGLNGLDRVLAVEVAEEMVGTG